MNVARGNLYVYHDLRFFIRENSFMARLAARWLSVPRVAMVIGRTIHLHNCDSTEFIKNKRWLKHELEHIRQYQRYGFGRFIILYLWESLRHGYYNNRFEREARKAEI